MFNMIVTDPINISPALHACMYYGTSRRTAVLRCYTSKCTVERSCRLDRHTGSEKYGCQLLSTWNFTARSDVEEVPCATRHLRWPVTYPLTADALPRPKDLGRYSVFLGFSWPQIRINADLHPLQHSHRLTDLDPAQLSGNLGNSLGHHPCRPGS